MNGVNTLSAAIELIGIAGLVAFSYASTNLDNFIVLSAYSAKPGYRPLFGRLAFVSVCLTVILASLLLARAADTLIADKLRYLGVIPLGLGLYQLGKLGFQRSQPDDEEGDGQDPALVASSFYFGFGLALLANSSDSVIVLTPIFADLKLAFIVICAIAAVAVALTLSSVAGFIGTHPLLRAKVEKIGHWALPFLLIGIGLMILLNKPDDAFVATGGPPSTAIARASRIPTASSMGAFVAPAVALLIYGWDRVMFVGDHPLPIDFSQGYRQTKIERLRLAV